MILFGINKGFDLSDEGLYTLLLNPHQSNEAGVYNYDLFFKFLYKLAGIEFGIIGSRVLRLISYFVGGFSLALFWKNIQSEKRVDFYVLIISVMALFSGYAFLPPSLSYNSLSVVIVCGWLAVLSIDKPSIWMKLALGFLLALLFYVKITTCLIIGGLSILVLTFQKKWTASMIVSLLLPIVLLESTFYLFLSEAGSLRIWDGVQMMGQRADYQWELLFKHNLVGVFWCLVVFVPFFITAQLKPKLKWVFLALSLVFVGWVMFKTMITDEWNHTILIITFSFIAYYVGKRKEWSWKSTEAFFLIILLLLPFSLHFGSNVYFLRLGIQYWAFLVLGGYILLDKKPAYQKTVFNYIFSILSLALILNGIWLSPFEQLPLSHNTIEWEYSEGKKIYLPKEKIDVLQDVKSKINGIPEEEIIAVYRNPGWMVLLDLTSPKNPGIWDEDQLNTYFPNFPNGFKYVIYFPYQKLPDDSMLGFTIQNYSLSQGDVKLLWRK